MEIKTIKVGYLQTNCYIIINKNKAIIIDPGDEAELIKQNLKGLELQAILITHSHFDHIGALKYFENTKIYDDKNLEEKEYELIDLKFNVIKTKGHTNDSISFYFKNQNIMFTGDFVFEGTVGRTDLETGNMEQMQDSINKIKEYSDRYRVYPGHGDITTLGEEKLTNPFLR